MNTVALTGLQPSQLTSFLTPKGVKRVAVDKDGNPIVDNSIGDTYGRPVKNIKMSANRLGDSYDNKYNKQFGKPFEGRREKINDEWYRILPNGYIEEDPYFNHRLAEAQLRERNTPNPTGEELGQQISQQNEEEYNSYLSQRVSEPSNKRKATGGKRHRTRRPRSRSSRTRRRSRSNRRGRTRSHSRK